MRLLRMNAGCTFVLLLILLAVVFGWSGVRTVLRFIADWTNYVDGKIEKLEDIEEDSTVSIKSFPQLFHKFSTGG